MATQEKTMQDILAKLKGADRRSIGRSNEVVAQVLADPSLFRVLFGGMLSDDPVLRMRSADAIEKVTAKHPEYLRPYKRVLLEDVARIEQQEVRWHVAQLFSRLELDARERKTVVGILLEFLSDKSSIVKTFSMQTLADIAQRDATFRAQVIKILGELTQTGTPAMKSRGRKLLTKFRR